MLRRHLTLLALALLVGLAALPAAAQELKIGLLTTLSGPGAGLGTDIRDGFKLGLERTGGKLGGVPVALSEADDQRKPEVAVQKTEEMVSRDGIYLMTGQVWSNLALAMMPTHQVETSGVR